MGSDTRVEATVETSVTATTLINGPDDGYDFLAYFADFTFCCGNLFQNATQRLLLGIFLDKNKQKFPNQSNSGSTSHVFVMKSKDFLEPAVGDATENPLPEVIAVKFRTVKGSPNTIKDWRPLKSLSNEMKILTDHEIRDHPNIVSFLGNCWQYSDEEHSLILPVMVFEATTLGDLKTYHDQHPDLALGVQLQLGLGVTRGVAALHEAGIIHCDIKPKNVLVFRHDDAAWPLVSKLIDFDLAILHQHAPDQVTPPQGTKVWNSPEQRDDRVSMHRDDLFKIDIFSLAMVLLNLLTSNALSRFISVFGNPDAVRFTGGMTLQQYKCTGSLAANVVNFLNHFANISGPNGDNAEFSAFRVLWMRATKILTCALDGDYHHRIISAAKIERGLQGLLEDVKSTGLLEYHNKEVAMSAEHKDGLIFTFNNVPGEERNTINKLNAFLDSFLTACQPEAVQLARILNTSVDAISSMIYNSGDTFRHQFLIDNPTEEDISHVPTRALKTRKGSLNVVKISHNLGTFAGFPLPLKHGIMAYLKGVYSSPKQYQSRRAEAAFEHAIASVTLHAAEKSAAEDAMDESLETLRFAAENGHSNAQYLLVWMETSFARKKKGEPITSLETSWLKSGVIEGSRTSRILLQKHNQAIYKESIHQLQTERRGMGGASYITPNLPVYEMNAAQRVWLYASTGNIDALRRILTRTRDAGSALLNESINRPYYEDNATPLIEACRSGHTEVVYLLLQYGADASLRTSDGVGPLHFLSSFPPPQMLDIATVLIDNGCLLEGWTHGAPSSDCGGAGLDQIYELADGTPLLWAVAADCTEAVTTLLQLGADPFARPPHNISEWARADCFSPVLWAATMHQSEILELLLQHVDERDIPIKLNTCWLETHTGAGDVGPLGYACMYGGGRVLSRMVLHGAKHVEQCTRTITMLLNWGADPRKVANSKGKSGPSQETFSALDMASQFGQPYAIRAILQWKGGITRPSVFEWCKLLAMTANHGSRACFEELMKIEITPDDEHTWPSIIATIAEHTQEKRYLHAVISKHQTMDAKPADYTIPFATALGVGCLESAEIIFERSDRLDMARLYDSPGSTWKFNLLGLLLHRAKMHPNRVSALKTFLELVGPRDDIFENVIVPPGEEGLNALQFAMYYAFDSPNASTGTDLLEILLKKFNHPIKHLACRHGFQNNSLLHYAVQFGNYAALEILLNLRGINFDARNFEDLTAFDACLRRWQDSTRDSDGNVRAAIEAGKGKEWAHGQWRMGTELMMASMQRKGASKYGKISHLFKRLSHTEELCITISAKGEISRTVFDPAAFRDSFVFDGPNREDAIRAIQNLPIGKCVYFLNKDMV